MGEYVSTTTHVDTLNVNVIEMDETGRVNVHLSSLYFVLTKEHAQQLADGILNALKPKPCPMCGKE